MILGSYMHEDKAECCEPKKGLCVQGQRFLLLIFIFGIDMH